MANSVLAKKTHKIDMTLIMGSCDEWDAKTYYFQQLPASLQERTCGLQAFSWQALSL